MARRRKEDALETRERILDAAIEVFHKRGVSRPSLTEIAELAGVTRGAVYGHFQNKADLFIALTDRIQLPDESLCQAPLHGGCDPLGELRKRSLFLFREVMNDEQYRRVFEIILMRCELVTENGEILKRCTESHAEGDRRLRKLVEAAITAGQLPEDLDPNIAVPILHGSVIGLLNDWLINPAYDLVEVGTRQVDALLEMLQSSPHLKRSGTLQAPASA
ncbi:TetR family transcriptional regulator [uncultured Microbulbifer sp.]|uniref:TetR family transcriptional regulator n=1 Tax=uncultured Microbulbifer sp. TaxID=348147 RepID=UPI0025FFBCD3|nr:TetR family transcriptional regulator [uncultured Microbulbifer sp.]